MRKRGGKVACCLMIWGCVALLLPWMSGCGGSTSESSPEVKVDKAPIGDGEVTTPEAVVGEAPIDDLPVATASEGDWPWWRGPGLSNIAAANQDPPQVWSETENVRWRVKLPGRGHATPCLCGDHIYVPSADKEQEVIWMLCIDRDSGDQLWRTEVWHGALPKIHKNNSHASATPACDGQRVYFPYQTDTDVRLVALDLDGQIVWNETVAPYKSVQGYSASPALYKSAVIVPTDGSKPNKLTALHRESGKIIWQVPRPDNTECYASPLVARVAGREQLFIIGPDKTRSYNPDTGALLWQCDGPTTYNAATVAFGADTIYATGGYPGKALLAIRADGSGDVTETHLTWKSDKKAGYVSSPLLHNGLLYAVSDSGLMRVYDAVSGDVHAERDLDAKFYSSPVLVGDRIYVFDREGKGYIVKAGHTIEVLAENGLPDGAFATPVICGGRIYLRTLGDFYCLEKAAVDR